MLLQVERDAELLETREDAQEGRRWRQGAAGADGLPHPDGEAGGPPRRADQVTEARLRSSWHAPSSAATEKS